MSRLSLRRTALVLGLLALMAPMALLLDASSVDRQTRGQPAPPTPGPMLAEGTLALDAPSFALELVRSSQTVAALRPKGSDGFDFTPADQLIARSRDGYYHLGDLDLRLRAGTSGPWVDYSTAASRAPVTARPTTGSVLASADLGPTLPADIPLGIVRSWEVHGGTLALRFAITNRSRDPVEIGGLGIPMVFNNILTGRSLDEAHAKCVFYDPYIGLDAGYLQVTRLSGHGPALIVVPEGNTPFEAYQPILSPPRGSARAPLFTDPTPRSVTFEGFYDWMVHSRAFAEHEWKKATPWNPPTSAVLAPGESRTYGVRFLLASEIRAIERTLTDHRRPVAVGVPGYVLPQGIEARLFLMSPSGIRSVEVVPAGAITVRPGPTLPSGWRSYLLAGRAWGRARLEVAYVDGTRQSIHYTVIKTCADAVADLGRFMTTSQWFEDPADPFKRSPSVMTYDREENRIVTQDSRVWIAGLGDEGGSSWLAGAMKQVGLPDKGEIEKYQRFIDGVVWGGLQHADGPRQYAVRKSLFYYQPDQMPAGYYRADLNWGTWTSWNKQASEAVDRSYDYPHVAALHWAMYRLARNQVGLVTNHPWDWYLERAYRTAVAMVTHARRYAQYGQMEGTIFLEILKDLQREGWSTQAADLEARMRDRAAVWSRLAYPFGSEMPWDSTGQEEVYAWTKHFGDRAKARVTLDAIVAYMPAVPHWGYHGSARRYWDFQYAGKVRRVERQLHHYGSGLNAIPVLSEFRDKPDDLHLLRIGHAGMMGALTSIDQAGFASAAFHAFPDMLAFDPISGDYAQNFLGHALNTATYLVEHPDFGWIAFGGNLSVEQARLSLTPLDSFRTRVYLANLGLWLTLDAGRFTRVEVDRRTGAVRVALAPATAHTPTARVRIEQPAAVRGVGSYATTSRFAVERGAHVVPLGKGETWVELRAGAPVRGGRP